MTKSGLAHRVSRAEAEKRRRPTSVQTGRKALLVTSSASCGQTTGILYGVLFPLLSWLLGCSELNFSSWYDVSPTYFP